MKTLLLIVASLLVVAEFAHSQTLRRVDSAEVPVWYSEPIDSLPRYSIVSWRFRSDEGKWISDTGRTASVAFCIGSGGAEPIGTFFRFTVRHTIARGDTATLLEWVEPDGHYKYPAIKEGWIRYNSRRVLVIPAARGRDTLLAHISLLDTATADWSPGVRTYSFKTIGYETVTDILERSDSAVFGEAIKTTRPGNRSYSARHFALAVFPVRIDGVSTVRFIPYSSYRASIGSSPECFDKGYFEMPLQDFKDFLSSLR